MKPADVYVWDPLVRIGHWGLVASVAVAWLTRHGWPTTHEVAGHIALAIVAVRLIWGFAGPRYARFAQFVRGPAHTVGYVKLAVLGREPRHMGHNPLGAWMIAALLMSVSLLSASGWLYTTDAFWGVEWIEILHSTLSDALLVLITLHMLGVVFASIRHRENLAAAMINGRKRAATNGDQQ